MHRVVVVVAGVCVSACAVTPEAPSHAEKPAPVSPGESRVRPLDEVMEVLLAHAPDMKSCAVDARLREPHVSGKAVVEFVIGPEGNVTSVRALSFANSSFAKCVVEQVYPRMKFPRADRPELVVFPMKF